jgi:hypothetical protein
VPTRTKRVEANESLFWGAYKSFFTLFSCNLAMENRAVACLIHTLEEDRNVAKFSASIPTTPSVLSPWQF